MILDEMRSHSVILEDMRSQNRATIEAVDATRAAMEQRFQELAEDTRARIAVLEVAIRHSAEESRSRDAALEAALARSAEESRSRDAALEAALGELKVEVQQISVGLRDLTGKVAALERLEERLSALERRLA